MATGLNQIPTQLEPIAMRGKLELDVTSVWYKFFQSLASLYSGSGGSTGASALLDTIGSTVGGMLSRFGSGWQEFEATVPNSIPVMNPSAPISLRTMDQLLDAIGGAQGDVLFRGAAGWQALAPVAGRFFQSQGPGVNPVYAVGVSVSTVALALTATGTVQGDALVLAANWNEITTTPVNSGAVLGALGIGQSSITFNEGANALKVYPPVGGQIDVLAVNAPYSLAATKMQQFFQLTGSRWRSTQLG